MSDLDRILGNAARHLRDGDLEGAERLCRYLISQQPDCVDAMLLLADIAHQIGRFDAALDLHERALALGARSAAILTNAGLACAGLGRYEDALHHYGEALALAPNAPGILSNMGNALYELERVEEAIACYERALAGEPTLAAAMHNLGTAWYALGRIEEARSCHERALALRPDHPASHTGLADTYLVRGEFERGFAEYEWRWRTRGRSPPDYAEPEWDGSPLPKGRLLVHAEQGLGDTIQFMRFLPQARQRVAALCFECQPELLPLVKSMPGLPDIVRRGQVLPKFDRHIGLLSLPRVLAVSPSTIPAPIPYLRPANGLRRRWRARLTSPSPRVGLVWSGSSSFIHNRIRSFRFEELAPLLELEAVSFYGLQKGPAAAESAAAKGASFISLADEIASFDDTAAILAELDLLISMDTSVLHLAGALGCPAWGMLTLAPDWRWQLQRRDTPWYPSVTLFRQPAPGKRAELLLEVRDALRDWLAGRA